MSIRIHDQGHPCRKVAGVFDLDMVEIAIEGGLVRRARVQRDLNASGLACRVVVDVEVGGFVEAVEERSGCRSVEVRMKVGVSVQMECMRHGRGIAPGCAG